MDLSHASIVGMGLEECQAVIDIGVADEEVEPDARAAGLDLVVDGRDHLLAVHIAPDDIAGDGGLDQVAVLHAIFLADQLLERGEIADLAVPADDLGVTSVRLQAAPEHLIAVAPMRLDAAPQPDLHFLEILVGLVLAEDPGSAVLVASPASGEDGRG